MTATATTPDASVTIDLLVPVTVQGRNLTSVTLRRPKVGDLRRMDKVKGSEMERTLYLIGQLAELAPAEVDELDAADLATLGDVVTGFTAR